MVLPLFARKALCILLALVCAFSFLTVPVRAVALSSGVIVCVSAVLAVGAALMGLGIGPIADNVSAFNTLCDNIVTFLSDSWKFLNASGNTMIKALQVGSSYFFQQEFLADVLSLVFSTGAVQNLYSPSKPAEPTVLFNGFYNYALSQSVQLESVGINSYVLWTWNDGTAVAYLTKTLYDLVPDSEGYMSIRYYKIWYFDAAGNYSYGYNYKQVFYDLPRRYIMDIYERETGFFHPRGIHMFCGEQGAGKTIACVEMMTRLQTQYPAAKTITNFGLMTEDNELREWQQLLDYTNGHKGVIVGIDEIQNWFMSGKNQLPEGMLEVATQNRKNNRVLCCTAQVFTRVNKGLREQVTMVYNPHTYLGCFTVVVKRKPCFDSEGNVKEMKYRGMYCFVHTEKLRTVYDTYKVIHTLAREGFKESPAPNVTNVYVSAAGKRK